VVAAGTVSEAYADGTVFAAGTMDGGVIGGIALTDGDTTRTYPAVGSRPPAVADDWITYCPFNRGTLFITNNMTDADGAAVVPTGAMRGDVRALDFFTGVWSVSAAVESAGTNVYCVVHDVLNARKEPIATTDTTTGVYTVFEIRTA
jgi:hypothetical protein